MRLKDFENRFEATLQAHKVIYCVEERVENCAPLGDCWTWKEFKIQARQPKWEGPLLVSLGKHHRSSRSYRRAKTSCTCFVVEPFISHRRSRNPVKHGLRNVWSYIRIHCLPL